MEQNRIRFNSDYTEGAHPLILEKLVSTNLEQTPGYGEDHYCREAAECIRRACKAPEAAVHFLVGGTQTNSTVIAAALKPYQGVITADSGHINNHETGAVEATGHKVIALPGDKGKLTAGQIAAYVDWQRNDPSCEHIVEPGMVYVSNPTEVGTIYSRQELTEISRVCRERGVYLFLDGARLGYGLACRENDLDLPAISELCDVFYIGGTKVGALFGEAVVIVNNSLKKGFRFHMKQRGGMLAKGRLLGLQFLTLFENGLYFEISAHGARLAELMRDAFAEMGIPFFMDSPTNQQFVILPDEICERLREKYEFEYWERVDESHSAVRFCTSWATKEEQVQALLADMRALLADMETPAEDEGIQLKGRTHRDG